MGGPTLAQVISELVSLEDPGMLDMMGADHIGRVSLREMVGAECVGRVRREPSRRERMSSPPGLCPLSGDPTTAGM